MLRSLVVAALFSFLAPMALADADLHLVVNNPPAGYEIPTPAGSMPLLEFTVFNNGPDAASDVILSIELPPGVSLARGGDPRCNLKVNPVRCNAFGIAPGAGVAFTFTPEMPVAEGRHTITVTASSATPDPRSDNNRITATYVTSYVADLHVNIEPSFARADPGELVTFRAQVSNFYNTIPPANPRVRFEADNGVVESVVAPQGWTCTKSECTAPTLVEGAFEVRVRVPNVRNGAQSSLRVVASSSLPDLYEGNNTGQGTVEIFRWITVTNVNDAGAGSLRAAIEHANQCGSVRCKIAFEIAAPVPADGWHTIQPSTPLPPITSDHVWVDGATQTKFSGDTNPNGPEVAIDGRFTSEGHGLQIGAKCSSEVTHLAIGNFRGHGIVAVIGAQCLGSRIEQRRIANNHIGVDPGGTVAWPNLRGLDVVTIAPPIEVTGNLIRHNVRSGIRAPGGGVFARKNRIEQNGASGVYIGGGSSEVNENVIVGNGEMGVAVERGASQIEIRQNSMRDNGGLGIDWELDGVSPMRDDSGAEPSNAPVLLAARYDATRRVTIVTVKLQTNPIVPYAAGALLDFYANATPDGEGEQHVVQSGNYALNVKGEPFDIEFPVDLRGKWMTATSTRIYFLFSAPPDIQSHGYAGGVTRTSEFSNSIQVTE